MKISILDGSPHTEIHTKLIKINKEFAPFLTAKEW